MERMLKISLKNGCTLIKKFRASPGFLKSPTDSTYLNAARYLFSLATLGVEDYVKVRQKYVPKADQFDRFLEKMKEYSFSADPTAMIFTEDLKHFIHLTSGSDEELSLGMEMLKKFYRQNAQLRFGNYTFGPVVMRMYHHFNRSNEALELYNHPELDGFFDQLSTYVILMDLLFRNEKYNEIVSIYRRMSEKQLHFGKYPKNVMILLYSSFYKINTEEMFNYALSLWKEMRNVGLPPLRRVASCVAALALKQNSPHIALEVISVISNQNFVLIRSLKACSLCALGRIEDVFPLLTSVLTFDAPNIPKQTFPYDVLQTIKEAVEKRNNKELLFEFSRIEKQLQDQNHISSKTFDELLLSEVIIVNTVNSVNRSQSVLRAAFNGVEDTVTVRRKSYTVRRPGLTEMS